MADLAGVWEAEGARKSRPQGSVKGPTWRTLGARVAEDTRVPEERPLLQKAGLRPPQVQKYLEVLLPRQVSRGCPYTPATSELLKALAALLSASTTFQDRQPGGSPSAGAEMQQAFRASPLSSARAPPLAPFDPPLPPRGGTRRGFSRKSGTWKKTELCRVLLLLLSSTACGCVLVSCACP